MDEYEVLTKLNEKLRDFYASPSSFKCGCRSQKECTCCNNPFFTKDELVMCAKCLQISSLHIFHESNVGCEHISKETSTTCSHCKQSVIVFYLNYKEFFCLECNNFVIFEHDAIKYLLLPCLTSLSIFNSSVNESKKRKLNVQKTNNGDNTSVPIDRAIRTMLTNTMVINSEQNSLLGLRGMVNLGHTCFMSCILQAFAHYIPLRNYFLSGIDQKIIEMEIENDSSLNDSTEMKTYLSMSKALGNMFQELYNPILGIKPVLLDQNKRKNGAKRKTMDEKDVEPVLPFVPHQFLYIMWNVGGELAGYQQQDAHEFYMAVLSALCPSKLPNHKKNYIESLFTGRVQSDLKCGGCGKVSTTIEPFIDISLPLKMNNGEEWVELQSLTECLERYTKNERLDMDYKCTTCGRKGSFSKQLRLKNLPNILCFHLKRFEHSEHKSRSRSSNGVSSKIDNFISFPMVVDMKPYVGTGDAISSSPQSLNYSLFSVVCHHGDLTGGHYNCFVKHHSRWYLCNDSIVYYATEEDVLQCEAYLLFYALDESVATSNVGMNNGMHVVK